MSSLWAKKCSQTLVCYQCESWRWLSEGNWLACSMATWYVIRILFYWVVFYLIANVMFVKVLEKRGLLGWNTEIQDDWSQGTITFV